MYFKNLVKNLASPFFDGGGSSTDVDQKKGACALWTIGNSSTVSAELMELAELSLKQAIMQIAKDAKALTDAPTNELENFHFELVLPHAILALELDHDLALLRHRLVPKKFTDEAFWKRYLQFIAAIRIAGGHSPLPEPMLPCISCTPPPPAPPATTGNAAPTTTTTAANTSVTTAVSTTASNNSKAADPIAPATTEAPRRGGGGGRQSEDRAAAGRSASSVLPSMQKKTATTKSVTPPPLVVVAGGAGGVAPDVVVDDGVWNDDDAYLDDFEVESTGSTEDGADFVVLERRRRQRRAGEAGAIEIAAASSGTAAAAAGRSEAMASK